MSLPRVTYGSVFTPNGYLVLKSFTEEFGRTYQGIDDWQWPIELNDDSVYGKFMEKMGYPQQMAGVQVATNWDHTIAYFNRCIDQGIAPRLLLVSTRYVAPVVVPPAGSWKRLGIDVAEPLGVHSVIRQELLPNTAPRLSGWRERLNSIGLFDDLATAEEYLADRSKVAQTAPTGIYRSTDFVFVPVLLAKFVKNS